MKSSQSVILESTRTISQNKSVWDLDLQYLKGVGEKLASLLGKADIKNLWDLLLTLPRTYEDRRHFHTHVELLALIDSGQSVLGRAVIESIHSKGGFRRGFRGPKLLEAVAYMEHSSQKIIFTWFNDYGGSIEKRFPVGTPVIFSGKAQSYKGQLQIVHPDLQKTDTELAPWEYGGFVPIYKEISGISTKVLRKILALALDRAEFKNLPDGLPDKLLQKLKLSSMRESLRELHFPKTWEPQAPDFRPAGEHLKRLAFEELFMMALALHMRRSEWKLEGKTKTHLVPKILFTEEKLEEWKDLLPYKLTTDQNNVLHEVLEDMSLREGALPMHRLVQGDVGSGKTIVAFLACLSTMNAGYQAVLMASTEILADQHYRNFCSIFPELAHRCCLLKGALSEKEKKNIRAQIESGQFQFVIGTQALLTETTLFEKLGLIVVDEQHRFGVEQRLGLKKREHGSLPHLLVMTATPIPRSLALTLYGDLNLSQIREKPAGRLPIETHLVKRKSQAKLGERLKLFLAEGRQIYIVYPLVEESEELDMKDALTAHKEWSLLFGAENVALLHGRMKSKEKDSIMREFKAGKTKVLVTTTVIEVGVDVPNASVIVIEHAERFGLSQLHQLRGRVGRGSTKSYCVLVGPDFLTPLVEERLKALVNSNDGFVLAEKDLEIRGPGEFLGRKQSGLPGFRVAHILRDVALLETAREEARLMLESDPKLSKTENAKVRFMLKKWWQGRLELTLSG